MKGINLLALSLLAAALAAAACTTKFKDVDAEEEEDAVEDGRDADLDTRDDGDGRDDGDAVEDEVDAVEMDGDVDRQCDAGPCCETSLGVFLDTSFVCESRTEYSCGTEGCGADATETTVEHHCSGTSAECNGETITIPGTSTDCTPDQVCDTDRTTYATCVTCDDGCAGGSCNNPDCTGGPCCNTDLGTFRPSTFQCDSTPVESETRCVGGCGGMRQRRSSFRYCTGDSAACGDANIVFDDWRDVGACAADQACMEIPDAMCVNCEYGCNPTSGDCNPECSPADPCCDGTGHFWLNDHQCSAEPDHTVNTCLGNSCGAQLNVVDYMRFCTGGRADCGTGNLQPAAHTEDCGSNGRCVPSATPHCETCPYACYNDVAGLAVCYDDPYERNNTPDEAMARARYLFSTPYPNARLDGTMDGLDHYAFDFDELGGAEAWQVTATVTVDAMSGAGIPRLIMTFTSPTGQLIDEAGYPSVTTGVPYTLTTILSGGDPSPDTFLLSLRLDSAPTRQIQYTFNVTRVSRTSATIACGDYTDTFEPNNSAGTASPISLDTMYPGLTLCNNADIDDYYSFDISTPTKVTASFDFNVVTEDTEGLAFYFRDASDRALSSVGTGIFTGMNLSSPFTFSPGTYIVFLSKWGAGDYYLNYSLTLVSSAPCIDDSYDTFAAPYDDFPEDAPVVSPGTYVYVFCQYDNDWRSINVLAGHTLTVTTDVQAHTGEVMTKILNPNMIDTCVEARNSDHPQTAACTASVTGNYRVGSYIWEDQKNYTQILTITP